MINLLLVLSLLLNSCTYSINVIHTEGTASDVVDETQSADHSLEAKIPVV